MKKVLVLLLAIAMLCTVFAACAQKVETSGDEGTQAVEEVAGKPVVAFLMPTKEQPIWAAYGERLVEAFEGAGYETTLEYAEDMVERQVAQIENAVLNEAEYIVLASVDSYAVSDAVEKAKADGVTIIACDRLIMNTEAVDYYVTFDLVRMGEIQGEFIEGALGLDAGEAGPFNLEIFSGSPDDPNSFLFYEGAMDVLQPYLDEVKLVVQSGQVDIDVNGTLKWDGAAAQARMDNILSAYYSEGETVDAVLAAADCVALGVISSLNSMGYGQGDLAFPVVVGQDCEITAIKSILAGQQSMSVFLDAVVLADKVLGLVDSLVAGEEPKIDDSYNNDVIDVPTALYDPVLVTEENYEILIDRGFYTAEDLQ